MRPTLTVLAVLLLAAPARADPPIASQSGSYRRSSDYTGPYSVYGPGLTYKQSSSSGQTSSRPFFSSRPTSTFLSFQGSAVVPDGGEALLAGYSTLSEGRNEFGAPGLGKVPYLDRGFRNVGVGRDIKRTTVSVRARIIILSEEEERQTGVRP
jgi:hypothetical protein